MGFFLVIYLLVFWEGDFFLEYRDYFVFCLEFCEIFGRIWFSWVYFEILYLFDIGIDIFFLYCGWEL